MTISSNEIAERSTAIVEKDEVVAPSGILYFSFPFHDYILPQYVNVFYLTTKTLHYLEFNFNSTT